MKQSHFDMRIVHTYLCDVQCTTLYFPLQTADFMSVCTWVWRLVFEGLFHHLNHSFFFFFNILRGTFIKIGISLQVQYICTLSQRLTFLSFLPVNWIEFAQHHRKAWEQRLNYIPNAVKAAVAAVSHELNTGTSILRLVLIHRPYIYTKVYTHYVRSFQMKQLGREIAPSKCVFGMVFARW